MLLKPIKCGKNLPTCLWSYFSSRYSLFKI